MKITKRKLRRIIREELESMSVDKRDQLMDAVQKKFGLKHVKTTEEWDGTPGGVWLSAEEGTLVPGTELPLFDYYLTGMDSYEFGIHQSFENFVSEYGFFPEWYDPGTLMLWRM